MIQQLIQIGFNEIQAKVYVAVLELGKTSIARIVRKSGVSKKLCYKALDFFLGEGFVASEGKKKRLFFITDVGLIEEKLHNKMNVLSTFLPQLYSAANRERFTRTSQTYTSADAIRGLFKQQMRREKQGSCVMAIESSRFEFFDFMEAGKGGMALEVYERNRLNRNIHLRVLLIDELQTYQKSRPIIIPRADREIRYTSSSVQNNLSQIYIWSDRVWFMSYQNEDKVVLMELINSDVRQGMVAYFESLWKSGDMLGVTHKQWFGNQKNSQ